MKKYIGLLVFFSIFSCSAILGPSIEDLGLDISVGLMISDIFEGGIDRDVLSYSEPEEVLDNRYYALADGTSISENNDGSYHAIINFDYQKLAGLMVKDEDFCAYIELLSGFYSEALGMELKCEPASLAKLLSSEVLSKKYELRFTVKDVGDDQIYAELLDYQEIS